MSRKGVPERLEGLCVVDTNQRMFSACGFTSSRDKSMGIWDPQRYWLRVRGSEKMASDAEETDLITMAKDLLDFRPQRRGCELSFKGPSGDVEVRDRQGLWSSLSHSFVRKSKRWDTCPRRSLVLEGMPHQSNSEV